MHISLTQCKYHVVLMRDQEQANHNGYHRVVENFDFLTTLTTFYYYLKPKPTPIGSFYSKNFSVAAILASLHNHIEDHRFMLYEYTVILLAAFVY